MSTGAIGFTSFGSNGGCWVVLVLFLRNLLLLLFSLKKRFFFPCAMYSKKKRLRDLCPKKSFGRGKNAIYAPKKLGTGGGGG